MLCTKSKFSRFPLLILLLVSLLDSCYKEELVIPDTSKGFNFIVTPYQEKQIFNTYQNLTFSDTLPRLKLSERIYGLDKFEIRGESSLRYHRKSFTVNMDDKLTFFVESENQGRSFEKIKLISLVFDYTYIENSIGIGLFRTIGLWPTYNFYSELKLNDHTQGLYLMIEDPEEYFLYQKDASFIIRRHYDHDYKKYEANEFDNTHSYDYYLNKYYSIYNCILQYDGEVLYDTLIHLIDLPQYFSKLAVDLLLRNGDATDEVYLYTKQAGDYEIFGIYPWDLDDLFADLPHEINRLWACGTVFGSRSYYSMDDVVADVGEKLLFSIEDDLDYKIAKDDYLYAKYLESLNIVFSIITDEVIDEVISETYNQISPFYDNDEIIAQSAYDQDSTSRYLFEQNINDKREFLLSRRSWIIQKLNETKR
jgi:hypothetical protein